MRDNLRITYSVQFCNACVVVSGPVTAQAVVDLCRSVGAVMDSNDGDEEFCVELRADVGPELWTESSLRRSLAVTP